MNGAKLAVAIVHYHLAPGGVTRAIGGHLEALRAAGEQARALVLHGGDDDGLTAPFAQVRRVEGLGYDGTPPSAAPALAERIDAALSAAGLAPGACVVHVHNHALGKNPALPGALGHLRERGHHLLLQLHDLAEDFRPASHAHRAQHLEDPDAILYPLAPQVHYALLNPRDEAALRDAGVPEERLHLLPNPIAATEGLADRGVSRSRFEARYPEARGREVLLYPVRGIRRKNLGEALLWSCVVPHTLVATTLAPRNPVELPAWSHWTALARRLELPFVPGVGDVAGTSLGEHLAAADRVLTTSVAEGFGLVFLEPWLRGRDLAGRDLPEITAPFADAGVDLGALRAALRVPLEWVGAGAWRAEFAAAYRATASAYGRSADEAALARSLDALVEDGCVDFGRLGTASQTRVLERLRHSARDRERALVLNEALFASGDAAVRARRIGANADAVERCFGYRPIGVHLARVYRTVLAETAGPAEPPARSAAVLDAYLHPARFHPVRVDR